MISLYIWKEKNKQTGETELLIMVLSQTINSKENDIDQLRFVQKFQ